MKINFKKIDHVQLTIPKGAEDKARKFYTGVLGLEEIEKPDELKPSGGVWFKLGDVELHLGAESVFVPADGINPFSKRHPAFTVEKIDEAKKYLIERSVMLKEEIQIPGRKRFSFYDPFGNRIELLEFD
jgi:catechol 2,3-dioxygenase-like lactoylglutathione lyase family enzyme